LRINSDDSEDADDLGDIGTVSERLSTERMFWRLVTKLHLPIKEVDSWTLSEMRCACASMDMEDDYKRAYQTLVEMKGEK
jgi:hypothetical protein